MSLPTRPADRYGDVSDPARARRRLITLFAVFAAVVVAFAVWVGVEKGRTGVTWIELGLEVPDAGTARLTFQVELPKGATAVCTVSMRNDALAEVGRVDVTVGPSDTGRVRTTATARTSERASGARVSSCVLS